MVHTDLELLMQARVNALASLQHACTAHHRAMLEHAIADLDRRIDDYVARTPSSHPSRQR